MEDLFNSEELQLTPSFYRSWKAYQASTEPKIIKSSLVIQREQERLDALKEYVRRKSASSAHVQKYGVIRKGAGAEQVRLRWEALTRKHDEHVNAYWTKYYRDLDKWWTRVWIKPLQRRRRTKNMDPDELPPYKDSPPEGLFHRMYANFPTTSWKLYRSRVSELKPRVQHELLQITTSQEHRQRMYNIYRLGNDMGGWYDRKGNPHLMWDLWQRHLKWAQDEYRDKKRISSASIDLTLDVVRARDG